jgi:hypothetical protein
MQTQLPIKETPRKLTRGDLADINGATLILGCCTQGCCKPPYVHELRLSETAPS